MIPLTSLFCCFLEVWRCVRFTFEKLFTKVLDLISQRDRNEAREEELENHVQFLLIKFNHIQEKIRRAADKYLSKLIDKFPHLLWNNRVLKFILDLLHVLSDTTSKMQYDLVSREITIPECQYVLLLSKDRETREQIVKDFTSRSTEILQQAFKWAPSSTKSILQEYLLDKDKDLESTPEVHYGISLFTSLLLNPEAKKSSNLNESSSQQSFQNLNVSTQEFSSKDDASMFTSAVNLRSRYIGEMAGIKEALILSMPSADTNVHSMIVPLLCKKLVDSKKDSEIYASAMYKASAFLVSNTSVSHSMLLHLICWTPAYLFTGASMEIAVACWEWILAKRKDLEEKIQHEIIAAWMYTVNNHLGMFTKDKHEKDSITMTQEDMVQQFTCDVQPQKVWLSFLIRRYEVVSYYSKQQSAMYVSMLNHSLTSHVGKKSIICHNINVLHTRFQLAYLGLLLLQSNHDVPPIVKNSLREKVYHTILDYLSVTPAWPKPCVKLLGEDVSIMIQFWNALNVDKRFLKSFIVTSSLDSLLDPVSEPQERMTSDNVRIDGAQMGWLNLQRHQGSIGSTSKKSYTRSVNRQQGIATVTNELMKKRILLLAVLRREIERLSIWRNPKNMQELRVTGEDIVQGWASQMPMTDKTWKECIRTAWNVCPHVAVHVALRFCEVEILQKDVTRHVQSNPLAVSDEPRALQFLVNEGTIKQNKSELVHILAWASVPPLIAISFFSQQFPPHPLTAQYAVRVLQSYPSETMLFYIPQLVQALRYDEMGYVECYILWACNQSQLLAHQFIWNMKTNIFTDEDSKNKDPDIGEKLENMIEQITKSLSGPALKFFEREFDFFNRVTNISGEIRPYPKGAERRKACQEALKKITLQPGVYLPSNPEGVVVNIDYTSGIPMQSAAKAPFLAWFGVRKCGIKELEDMNAIDETDSVSDENVKHGETYTLGCIFKVGDDVRQDMLALQVIELFKKIFDQIGLDLYLAPYRVVATSPGCGVIECVPNAKSRDQLGRSTEVDLFAYFKSTYGDEESLSFQEARQNFIRSMAAYSVISFLLQIKDRHNGNIMINNQGFIIHIDFGFMFESSPGGNLGFEPDMKLTPDWVMLIGGNIEAPSFRRFQELCVRAYLAVRPYTEAFVSLVALMLDTGLPCFRGETLKRLKQRFAPNLTERQASEYMIQIIKDSYLNKRARAYDLIQLVQNEIPC